MKKVRNPQIISGAVSSTGTIVASNGDFTVKKGATGVYTLIFPTEFRVLSVVANCNASYNIVDVERQTTPNQVNVQIANSVPTNLDSAFTFIAVGV